MTFRRALLPLLAVVLGVAGCAQADPDSGSDPSERLPSVPLVEADRLIPITLNSTP
jgi:hypothetical protein